MGIIDTVIIILLLLLFLLGLYKGFIKQAFSIIAWFLAVLVPFLFSSKITELFGDKLPETAIGTNSLVFVCLFVITFIIVKIIGHNLGKSVQKGALGWIDRFLGGIWGLAKGLLIVCVVLLLLKGLTTIPLLGEKVSDFLTIQLKLNSEGFLPGKYLYENNLLLKLIELINKTN